MILDSIKKWFDKEEAEEIIEELTEEPIVEQEPEKPQSYSFM
jgi:hypothetical protein